MRRRSTGLKPAKRESKLENIFAWQLKAALPGVRVEREYQWHHSRKWRADFLVFSPAWPRLSHVMVEIEGGNFSNGRHVRGAGFAADCEKYNEASLLGYRLLRGTAKHVKSGELLAWVERALGK